MAIATHSAVLPIIAASEFNTVADMQLSSALTVGVVTRTLCYRDALGGNTYDHVALGTYVADGGAVIDCTNTQAVARFPNGTYNAEHWGAYGDSVTDDTAAILAMRAYVGAQGGGTVWFLKDYLVSSPNGTAIELTAAHSNITFAGAPCATIRPSTNTCEVFTQNGANNIVLQGINLTNATNGVLQNQVKFTTQPNVPPSGTNTWGNGINCAVRQYAGENLTVKWCHFTEFNISIHYIGDAVDNSLTVGKATVIHNTFDGCCFDALIDAPKEYMHFGNTAKNGIDSVNSDASIDPGHDVYVTDRSDGIPDIITILGNINRDSSSSAWKIRKGKLLICNENSTIGSERGIEVWNIEAGEIANNIVKLAVSSGANNSGVETTDCSNLTVTLNKLDIRGANAWGIRARADQKTSSQNLNNVYTLNTIHGDYVASAGKAPILISEQIRAAAINNTFYHAGSAAGSRSPVDVRSSLYCHVERIRHVAANNPVDAHKLISFDALCENCTALVHEFDADNMTLLTSIADAGVNTRSRQLTN